MGPAPPSTTFQPVDNAEIPPQTGAFLSESEFDSGLIEKVDPDRKPEASISSSHEEKVTTVKPQAKRQ